MIPDGADAVIIQEDTKADGDTITITEAAKGRHIRQAGVDFREGDVPAQAQTPLRPSAICRLPPP